MLLYSSVETSDDNLSERATIQTRRKPVGTPLTVCMGSRPLVSQLPFYRTIQQLPHSI